MDSRQAPTTVDAYIQEQPMDIQERLTAMRKLILGLVPEETKEVISWGMPTYKLHGDLVHFAAQKAHMGFYPGASGVEHFVQKLEGHYKYSKGGIQLPYKQPLPTALVEEIVRFRIQENLKKHAEKK